LEGDRVQTDRDYQLRHLERILRDGARSPVFRRNSKYTADGVPRIAYSDVMDYKLVVRSDPGFSSSAFWDEQAPVIARYDSIEALVDDGWRLD
jgi:hypothetical protein